MTSKVKDVAWFLVSPLVAAAYAAALPVVLPGLLWKLFKEGDSPHEA